MTKDQTIAQLMAKCQRLESNKKRMRLALESLRWKGIHSEWCSKNLDGEEYDCDCGKDFTNKTIDEALK